MSQTAVILTHVPIDLHKRVKEVAKKRRTSIAQFARDAIERRVDELTKIKEAEEEKRKTSAVTELKPLSQRPGVIVPIGVPIDRLAPIFEKHAQRLIDARDNPQELVIRQEEAFKEIKSNAMLTYNDKNKIADRLESLIAEKLLLTPTHEEEPQHVPLLTSAPPPLTAPANNITTPDVFRLLRDMFAPKQSIEEDPMVGKPVNLSRVRERVVVGGDDE